MNSKKSVFALICAVFAAGAAYSMEKMSLDGLWEFRFEKDKSLEEVSMPAFTANDHMIVPGCWNSISRYYNLHGTGCYRTTFEVAKDVHNAFLVVEGFGMRASFWVDGRKIGQSSQPWSTVEFQTGPMKAGRHEIVAAVDSIVDNKKLKMFWDFYDFYPFGGFYQGISLVLQHEKVELRKVAVRTRDYKTGAIELEALFEGEGAPADFTADVAFDGKPFGKVAFKGARASLNVPEFRLWSHKTPNLHKVTVKVPSAGQAVTERFGIRQVTTANGRIVLNGEPVYIKGVNRHEAHYEFGCSTPEQLMYEDITLVKDLGGNFIRGSHYPQCEKFLAMCDEIGILVWEESLGWGNREKQLDDPEFCDLQVEATRMMVRRSINHPCIIISGFLNEPQSQLPQCLELVNRLVKTIRDEDSGHLVTFASFKNDKDMSHVNTDIIAYNSYPGWYSHAPVTGTAEEMRESIRKCHEGVVQYYRNKYKDNRPIIVSESGVKADYGARDPRGKAQMTEDHQAEYTKFMIEELFSMKEIAGLAIWQMTDAKTYTRRNRGFFGRSYGVNTGGLFDLYRRPKLAVEEVRKLYKAKSELD